MVIYSSSALALGFLCQSVGLIRLPVLLDPSNLVASFTSLGKMSLPRQQHRLLQPLNSPKHKLIALHCGVFAPVWIL